MALMIAAFFIAPAIARAQSATTGPLSAPVGEMPDANPLQPNERRIPRAEFTPEMEEYWGIRLSEIEDEYVAKKGEETLFIDAGGRIYIKKIDPAQGYYGETGKSYLSTEQMLQAEQRWQELAEYIRLVREKITVFLEPDATLHGAARLLLDPPASSAGSELGVRVQLSSAEAVTRVLGIAVGYDPSMLQYERFELTSGTKLVDEQVRPRGPSHATLRLRVKHASGAASSKAVFGTIVFRAKNKGATYLEPLSVGRTAEAGKTYLELDGKPVTLTAPSEVKLRVP